MTQNADTGRRYEDRLKAAICEYLLEVNRNHGGPFIPPTAIDWLGEGIVSVALSVPPIDSLGAGE